MRRLLVLLLQGHRMRVPRAGDLRSMRLLLLLRRHSRCGCGTALLTRHCMRSGQRRRSEVPVIQLRGSCRLRAASDEAEARQLPCGAHLHEGSRSKFHGRARLGRDTCISHT